MLVAAPVALAGHNDGADRTAPYSRTRPRSWSASAARRDRKSSHSSNTRSSGSNDGPPPSVWNRKARGSPKPASAAGAAHSMSRLSASASTDHGPIASSRAVSNPGDRLAFVRFPTSRPPPLYAPLTRGAPSRSPRLRSSASSSSPRTRAGRPPGSGAQIAASVLYRPYHAARATLPKPTDTIALPARAGQPRSPQAKAPDVLPAVASRRRQAGIDQARQRAVRRRRRSPAEPPRYKECRERAWRTSYMAELLMRLPGLQPHNSRPRPGLRLVGRQA